MLRIITQAVKQDSAVVEESEFKKILNLVPNFSEQINGEIRSKILLSPQNFSLNRYGIKAGLDHTSWIDDKWIHNCVRDKSQQDPLPEFPDTAYSCRCYQPRHDQGEWISPEENCWANQLTGKKFDDLPCLNDKSALRHCAPTLSFSISRKLSSKRALAPDKSSERLS